MPMSSELAHAALEQLRQAAQGQFIGPEMQAIKPLLEIQQRWSALPTIDTLVVESMKSREGYHLFMYPFAGRSVHMGLASLFAYRIGSTAADHVLDRDQRLRLRAAGAPSRSTGSAVFARRHRCRRGPVRHRATCWRTCWTA